MARGTVINDARMIEHAGGKAAGFMTDAAILGGGHMVGLLADRRYPIMTRGTVIHDSGMIKHRVEKTSGVMTHAAIFGRGYVRSALGAEHGRKTN